MGGVGKKASGQRIGGAQRLLEPSCKGTFRMEVCGPQGQLWFTSHLPTWRLESVDLGGTREDAACTRGPWLCDCAECLELTISGSGSISLRGRGTGSWEDGAALFYRETL